MAQQTSAALLVVGDTGAGKTSLLATLAEWVWKKFKKVSRLYTFDPGGYGDDMQVLIEGGIVQIFRAYTRDPEGGLGLPLETCTLATRGYWPRALDPKTGIAPAGVDMVAPIRRVFTMYCPKGHPVRKSPSPQQLVPTACPTCKVVTNRENCSRVDQEEMITPGFEQVGAYFIDGISGMSEWCMQDMGARAAKNELGGEKAAINSLTSGGIKFGGTNRAAVGFVQNRAREWVMNSLAIPGQVIPPTFTALELRATDERTDLPIYGPKIAGNAKTAEVPSWFGNCLGAVVWQGEKGPEWRLYLQKYTLPGDSTPHLCKVRATPGVLPEFLVDPAEQPFAGFNLGRFYEFLEQSHLKAQERMKERTEGSAMPGMATGQVGGAAPPLAKKGKEKEEEKEQEEAVVAQDGILVLHGQGPLARRQQVIKDGAPAEALAPVTVTVSAEPKPPSPPASPSPSPLSPRATPRPRPAAPKAPMAPRAVPPAAPKKDEGAAATPQVPAPEEKKVEAELREAIKVGMAPPPRSTPSVPPPPGARRPPVGPSAPSTPSSLSAPKPPSTAPVAVGKRK